MRGYWFLLRPEVHGVKCVLTHGDRVLLVRHTYGPRDWDIPGGAVRRGEPPLHAARREMEEELGLLIDDWAPLGDVIGRMHHRRDRLHCFRAELDGVAIRMDPVELAAASWFPRAGLPVELSSYVERILARLGG
jgi:8-oxo-dGTP pyrophosphatase MutT (NUDIX family)